MIKSFVNHVVVVFYNKILLFLHLTRQNWVRRCWWWTKKRCFWSRARDVLIYIQIEYHWFLGWVPFHFSVIVHHSELKKISFCRKKLFSCLWIDFLNLCLKLIKKIIIFCFFLFNLRRNFLLNKLIKIRFWFSNLHFSQGVKTFGFWNLLLFLQKYNVISPLFKLLQLFASC